MIITIPIDVPTCKTYKIPCDVYQEALRKEFVNYEVIFLQNSCSGGITPNGIGVLKCEGEYEGVIDRIGNIFMGLIEKYNDPSKLEEYKFLMGIIL